MTAIYNGWLVLLSVVVSITASYVALDLASRVAASRRSPPAKYGWLAGGAISMGSGIWSMHFIGILGWRLPIPVSFDIPITVLSLAIAIAASWVALQTAGRDSLSAPRLIAGGLLMGAGIAGMHYTGMSAMKMQPPPAYEPVLFSLSIAIAIAVSMLALQSAFSLRLDTLFSALRKKAGSAMLMGSAIYGMHYAGMAATIVAPDSICTVDPQHINNAWLAGTLGGFTLLFLTATLLISAFDAYLAELAAKHARSLRQLNLALERQSVELADANASLKHEVQVRTRAEDALQQAHDALEARVAERTAGLVRSNQALLAQIAERERAEENLRQAQARTESVLNSMADTYLLLDRDWRYLYVNEAAVRAIGRPREQILGRTLWEIYPDIIGSELERQFRHAMDQRVPVVFDFYYPARDTWWENRFYPAPEGLAVFALDITLRKVAQELIRESESRLQAFMNNSPSAMFIKDLEGRYLHVNPQFLRAFGLNQESVLGHSDAEIFAPDQAAQFRASDARTLAIGVPLEFEITVTLADGVRTAIVCKFPITDAEGGISALGGIRTDITERKRAEALLRESEARLHEVIEDRERLARDLHDNIVQAIYAIGMRLEDCQRLVRDDPDEVSAQLAQAIDALNSVIRDVRRYIAGSGRQFPREPQLRAELDRLVAAIRSAEAPRIRLDVDDSAVEQLTRDEAEQVLNIAREALSNCLRHARAHNGSIALRFADAGIRLEIGDDGVGFDPQSPAQEGGGLRNMRDRAAQIGAEFEVLSSAGQGTQIIVLIPRRRNVDD